MTASGGRVVAALAAAAVALTLAGGATANCFDYCFKNCVGNDKSMADYCNYACDKTCEPGGLLSLQRPLAAAVGGLSLRCQIDCVRWTCGGPLGKDREDCYHECFDGCKAETVPRPLHAGVDAGSDPVWETETGDAVGPASVPDYHRFHEKLDAVEPDSP